MADDKPGLVESLSSIVMINDGNWQESRMCRLGGKFAGILCVLLPEEMETAFLGQIKQLEFSGIHCDVAVEDSETHTDERPVITMSLLGSDRPGIVNAVTKALRNKGINVEELETSRYAAPMSGELLFKASANLYLPANCSPEEIQSDLEDVANDMMVDISIN
jgi:glycine cleavage system regulatory protein